MMRRRLRRPSAAIAGLSIALGVGLGPLAGAAAETGARSGAPVVAGTGLAGSGGTGGGARSVGLRSPRGIALDPAGDLFVADTGNCRVIEVPARPEGRGASGRLAGHAYLAAGAGCGGGPLRTGGRATAADIGFADGVAVDGEGDLVIAATSENRVLLVAGSSGRRFGRSLVGGRLYLLAGTGAAGDTGEGGAGALATLHSPEGVAVDAAGDVFVADTANCRVREIPTASGSAPLIGTVTAGDIYSVAGSGVCGTPLGAGVDGDGGRAGQAIVWDPTAVAVDGLGDLLVADRGDAEVREVAATAGTFFGVPIGAGDIATVAGTGSGYGPYLSDGLSATGPTAGINFPEGVALDAAGDLLVADGYDRAVREVLATPAGSVAHPLGVGDMTTVIGALLAGPNQQGTSWVGGRVVYPWGVAVGRTGTVYFSDQGANVVRALTPSTP